MRIKYTSNFDQYPVLLSPLHRLMFQKLPRMDRRRMWPKIGITKRISREINKNNKTLCFVDAINKTNYNSSLVGIEIK